MDKELKRTLGAAARKARKSLAFTQEQVAERLDVSVEFYGRIERGMAWPSIPVFARMVSVLGVSANALLGKRTKYLPATTPPLIRPDDSQELHKLVALLHKAGPEVVHLTHTFVRELERMLARRARSHHQHARAK